MMIYCGMTVKKLEMLEVSARMMKALALSLETITLIGKGGDNLTGFVHYFYEINSEI
jgi:hypothetical protein